MADGITFEELGSSIWNTVRELDGIGLDILRYYSVEENDKAYGVMVATSRYHGRFIGGAYHCLCGLGYLEPYIDKEGVECARLTKKGKEAIQ